MNDEEKKAIKVVNKRTERLIEELKIEEEDLIDEPKIAYLITQIEANKTLINLIEKQSKEIEELKEKNKRLEKFIENGEHTWKQKYNETFKYVENEFVSKDKIKEKIEKIDKKIYEYKKWKELGTETDVDYYDYIGMEIAKTFMQSLLEKEYKMKFKNFSAEELEKDFKELLANKTDEELEQEIRKILEKE